jgi:hypothetical protein
MIINNIMPMLFGGLLKMYDDIYDITAYKEYFSELSIETIKCLIISMLTCISINNPVLPFIIFSLCLITQCFDSKELNSPFYVSGMIILFLLIMITFTPSYLSLNTLFCTLIFLIGAYGDHKYFPEDHSINKIIWRSIALIILIVVVINPKNIIYDESLFKIIYNCFLIFIGYFLISVINMIFIEYYKKDESNNNIIDIKNKEEKEDKEEEKKEENKKEDKEEDKKEDKEENKKEISE